MTELRVTLAPDGGIRLILPTGRPLDLGATEASLRFMQRILRNASDGRRHERGHIGEFPTQHVIEIWRREDLRKQAEASEENQRRKAEEVKAQFEALGIDVTALDISL